MSLRYIDFAIKCSCGDSPPLTILVPNSFSSPLGDLTPPDTKGKNLDQLMADRSLLDNLSAPKKNVHMLVPHRIGAWPRRYLCVEQTWRTKSKGLDGATRVAYWYLTFSFSLAFLSQG